MLLISHPASFLDALILIAAFDRQMHCLLDRRLFRGPWRGLLARGLRMIADEREGAGRQATLDASCQVLAGRGAVVVFAEQQREEDEAPPRLALKAATLALESELRHSGQLGLAIFPTHLYLPVAPLQSSELLIHIDAPLYPLEFLPPGSEELSDRSRALATALEAACRQNAFRLQPGEVEQFLSDLEEVLRSDLEEDWASRPNWKQNVESFRLSRFVAEWVEEINYLNPGRLVALRKFLQAYREARRRWSLRQLRVETAGEWLKSRRRRMLVWGESVLSLPLAGWGMINHLLLWPLLSWSGLLKKNSGRSVKVEWLLRALAVLVCYAGQISLCGHWLGRSWAGYYALTLPLSGAYLWRYVWLLRSRTRLLLIAVRVPPQAAKLRRMRKELHREVNAARDVYADALGVPH